jgi:hypothetical protein
MIVHQHDPHAAGRSWRRLNAANGLHVLAHQP